MRLIAPAMAALVWSVIPAQAHAASSCPVNVDFGEIAAVGTPHGYAEYLVVLTASPKAGHGTDRPGPGSSIPIRLLAGADSAKAIPVDIPYVTFSLTGVTVLPSDVILVVLPTSHIRWFSVGSTNGGEVSLPCSDSSRYELPTPLASTTSTFDDSAGWVKVGRSTSVVLDGPQFVKVGTPDVSIRDLDAIDQHDVAIAVVVNADGSLGETSATAPPAAAQPTTQP